MKQAIESFLRRRFVSMHGEGEAHQADIYRCNSCGKLVTWKKIRNADLCCQGHLNPTNPSMWEKLRLIVFP